MRFQGLDLNLLVSLDALLQERSVSLAAERLELSQSATSSALGRLRQYFGDDLLVVQGGRRMVLTPRGEELVGPVSKLLAQVHETIATPEPFDPKTTSRHITMMASDYVTEVLLQPALLQFAKEAPGLTFEIAMLGDDLVDELQRGRADLLISIDTSISHELPHQPLYEEGYVVAGWAGNEALDQPMTTGLYESLGHVAVRFGRGRVPSFEEWAIKRQAISRRIEVVAPSFVSAATLIIGSQRITTMHRRLARKLGALLPLKTMSVPFPIPTIRLAAQWSTRANNDATIAWVISRLRQIASRPDF